MHEHQQAQRQIIQANILAHINDAVIAIDNEHCVTYWNKGAERQYGIKANEILGQRLDISHQYRWLQPEDEQAAAEALVATGSWRGENIHIKKSGEQIYVESSVSLLKDDRGTAIGLLAVIRDISSRKQAEAALYEREEQLKLALMAARMGTWDWNVLTNDVTYSEQMRLVFGLSPGTSHPTYEAFLDAIHPEDRADVVSAVTLALEGKTDYWVEYRILWSDGSWHWVVSKGQVLRDRSCKPVRMVGVAMDISDRVSAQQKITQQAALLDIATDAIFVQDLTNQILFWNKGAEQIYGWQAAEVLGRNANQLLHRHAPDLAAALETVVRAGKWQGELNQVTREGEEIVVASRWTLVRTPTGEPKSVLVVNTDITQKKQLEAQLLRIQRLENLGTLASGIAHDLNNILTPILVVAQLLQLKYPDSERREMLDMIVANAKRGADLVKQVVSFARGVEGNRKTVKIASLLTEIVQIAERTFPKSIAIATQLPSDLWTVTADATQLHQVLMNLCINARDAMPDGGTLRISATNLRIDDSYTQMHIEAKVGAYVVITIADTGCGISPENLDRIFDPFFTTKETGKGTGLGLSMALGIIKSHDGFIEVSSRIGIGTQFHVYLPSNEDIAIDTAEDSALLAGRRELILVVDDEIEIDKAIETTLTSHNYRVLTAQNGIEAIALYAQYKHEIDLVLIDMMMPQMNGTTAINALQRINPQVQIVAMSGTKSASAIAQATNSSIQRFLSKPFTAEQLLKVLRQIFQAA